MTRFGFSFLCVAFFCFGFVLPVSSDPTKIIPYVSFEQEYNDNILFSKNNEEEDFITTLSGGLRIEQRAERLNANLDARLAQLLYRDFDELNSFDMFFTGDFNYRATERLGVGGSTKYSEDSRRDRDTATTGLLVTGDRTTKRVSMSSNYMFSEITRGNVEFGYGDIETKRVNSDEENDDFSINLGFSRNLSQTFKNTMGLLNFSYLHYTSDNENINPGVITTTLYLDNASDVFQLTAGFSKDITELYNVYCQTGGSYTITTEGSRIKQVLTNTGTVLSDFTVPDMDSSRWGGVLSAGLNYEGEYYDVGIAISQDMRGAAGTNGVVQRSMMSANVKKRLTDKFSLTLNANVFFNENQRKTRPDTEELTFNIQPGLRYKIFNDLILTGSYKFTSVEDRKANTTSESNMVYLLIRKEFEL